MQGAPAPASQSEPEQVGNRFGPKALGSLSALALEAVWPWKLCGLEAVWRGERCSASLSLTCSASTSEMMCLKCLGNPRLGAMTI